MLSSTEELRRHKKSSAFALNDYSDSMTLREDHERRPMWVTPSGIVFLEASSPFFTQAYDFVIAIAEPVSRPEFVHEYAINAYSLFAAASIGLSTEDILKGLDLFSKTQLDDYLIDFIKKHTERCGKVKLLLDKGKYFVESQFSAVLKELLQVRQIRDSRIDLLEGTSYKNRDAASGFLKTTIVSTTVRLGGDDTGIEVNQSAAMGLEPESLDAEEVKIVYSFEIDPSKVEQVRKSCHDLGYPTLEEYEFRKDTDTHNLPMSLRPIAKIRGYQEKSLSKMFGNGRARSGIIVLPCGAGKTLVGITATSTVRKNTLVLCNTGVSADQWKKQYQKWANIPDKNICVFTSSVKDELPTGEAVILITTYNMIAFSGRRSEKAMVTLREIASREWGLIVLDEVHVAPAKTFRTCLSLTKSRCKLGLTATLLREDDLIDDLFFLIGPKLYEANWLGLQKAGYLATVQCIEIRCPMTPEFYRQYLRSDMRKQQLLYVMNPNKFRACQHLIEWHESRGDKILVFSDIIYALEKYAKDLKKPFLHGKTSDRERLEFLSHLQYDDDVNTLFISKVGDTSIDLPDVNVIIQISSHFASRRQEAQRLGRILRPKASCSSRFNAFFYTLISEDTKEVLYATKRRSFLVDQGYSFQTVKYCNLVDESTNLMYSTKEEQLHLLSQVVAIDSAAGNIEDLADEDEKEYTREKRKENQRGKRKSVDVSSMTGGTGRVYQEFSNRAPKSRLQLEREREQKRLQSQTQKLKFQKESLIAEAEAEKKILAEKAALEAAKKA